MQGIGIRGYCEGDKGCNDEFEKEGELDRERRWREEKDQIRAGRKVLCAKHCCVKERKVAGVTGCFAFSRIAACVSRSLP